MGMKESNALGLMAFAMAMGSNMEDNNITERGNIGSSEEPTPIEPKKIIPFNEEPAILKMIEDYKAIKDGVSKKGKAKQNRIISKVELWIEKGILKYDDIV